MYADETTEPMSPAEALTYALLAINTAAEPTATSALDYEYLDSREGDALAALATLRDWVLAQGEDFRP